MCFYSQQKESFIMIRRSRERYRCKMNFFWYPFEVIVCNLEVISNEPMDKVIYEHANFDWLKQIIGQNEEQNWSNLEDWNFFSKCK